MRKSKTRRDLVNPRVQKTVSVVAVGVIVLSMICTTMTAFAKEINVSCVDAKVKEVTDIKTDMIQKAKKEAEAKKKAEEEAQKKAEEEKKKAEEEEKAKQEAEREQAQAQVQQNTQPQASPSWNGSVLSPSAGVNYGPSGKETYYNLDMSGVVSIMRGMGNNDPYWVREDGCKMLGNYIMVAAHLGTHPRGSLVETSLGTGIVCDTGGFAAGNANQLDIATNW